MDVEQPINLNEQIAAKEKNHDHDFSSYLITHLPTIARTVPLAREILSSSSKGENRSLADDMLRLNEIYKTPIDVEGQENIPPEGGFIFAVSHTSTELGFPGWKDKDVNPLWILAGMSKGYKEIRGGNADFRLIAVDPTSISKRAGALVRRTLHTYNGFPINKFNPRKALETIDEAKRAVANEDVLIISPEGQDSTEAVMAKRGIARLAETGKPVVPVAFVEEFTYGSYKHTVKFGEPIIFDGAESLSSLPRSEVRTKEIEFADKVGHAIASLLPEDMRGVYSQ